MNDLTSYSSTQSKDNRKFLIKRIDAEDIEIDNAERMIVLKALNAGVRFVQVRDYTLMLNAIKSIDPIRERKQSFPIDFIGDVWIKELPMSDDERNNKADYIAGIRRKLERKNNG